MMTGRFEAETKQCLAFAHSLEVNFPEFTMATNPSKRRIALRNFRRSPCLLNR